MSDMKCKLTQSGRDELWLDPCFAPGEALL